MKKQEEYKNYVLRNLGSLKTNELTDEQMDPCIQEAMHYVVAQGESVGIVLPNTTDLISELSLAKVEEMLGKKRERQDMISLASARRFRVEKEISCRVLAHAKGQYAYARAYHAGKYGGATKGL